MGHPDTLRRERSSRRRAIAPVGIVIACLLPAGLPGRAIGSAPGGKAGGPPPEFTARAILPSHARIAVPLSPDAQGPLPSGWSVREFVGKADAGWERAGESFAVRLTSERSSFALYREVAVDIAEYPYLSWAWRVDRLPAGGDARRRDLDDQAAQLYVVFPSFPAPYQIVGYLWDSTAPVGTILRSVMNPLVRLIVVRSGADRLRQWVGECRNVLEDFRRLFQEDPSEVMRIALLINSQHTRSAAESRFSRLLFTRDRPEGPAETAATPPLFRPAR